MNIKIICDNAGGITVQIETALDLYQHFYQHAADAAYDISAAVRSGESLNLSTWNGNEFADWLIPIPEQLSSGYYKIYNSPEELMAEPNPLWKNVFLLKNCLLVYNIKVSNKKSSKTSNCIVIK